jgi:SAM-dependent methyltransferase
MMDKMISKFAEAEEIETPDYAAINKRLLRITAENDLIDHREVNLQRFSDWFSSISCERSFYGSRFWEYPFAILAARLEKGMKCADIGCGSTPFTPYLCDIVGKENVSGFDPDYVDTDDVVRHFSFGARKAHIEKFGFHFYKNDFVKLDVPDDSFDRVFCISVLEHIDDVVVKQRGLQEMARILKPGGKLIITFDTGIDVLLNRPLQIIELSGLVLDGEVDLRWPEKRFVNYGKDCVDVFGLILQKPAGYVFLDYERTKKIPASMATGKYVERANWFNLPYGWILEIKDMHRPLGIILVMLKKLLGRY